MDIPVGIAKSLRKQTIDSFFEKLNYLYTGIMLLSIGLIIFVKQYLGSPIQCWMPAEYTSGWEEFVEDYCFIERTYHIFLNETLPNAFERKSLRKDVGYYQWVPFILIGQALLFMLPKIVWNSLTRFAGFDVKTFLRCTTVIPLAKEERTVQIRKIAAYFGDYCSLQTSTQSCWRAGGVHIVLIAIFVNLLYVANAALQFTLVNYLIGDINDFGAHIETFRTFLIGENPWKSTGIFPRKTLCDFEILRKDQLHTVTVECVLAINSYNEKIYIVFLLWIPILISINVIRLAGLFGSLFSRVNDVSRLLRLGGMNVMCQRQQAKTFTNEFLKRDGVFLLEMIASESDDSVAAELAVELYDRFYNSQFPSCS